jgi:hypothetical protein
MKTDGRPDSNPARQQVGHRPVIASLSIFAHWQNIGLAVYTHRAGRLFGAPGSITIHADFSWAGLVSYNSFR